MSIRRAEIVGSALASLPASAHQTRDIRVRLEMNTLLGAVEASLLVDDEQIVSDMLMWQAKLLRAHGYEDGDVVATALIHPLRSKWPTAADRLEGALANVRAG